MRPAGWSISKATRQALDVDESHEPPSKAGGRKRRRYSGNPRKPSGHLRMNTWFQGIETPTTLNYPHLTILVAGLRLGKSAGKLTKLEG